MSNTPDSNIKVHPFVQILKEELTAAMGCTEPIAIAYAAALARETLGKIPERITISVSKNIIKNVKSVIVPNTGGLHGVEAAVAAGTVMGDAKLELEVLSHISSEGQAEIRVFLEHVGQPVCLLRLIFQNDNVQHCAHSFAEEVVVEGSEKQPTAEKCTGHFLIIHTDCRKRESLFSSRTS